MTEAIKVLKHSEVVLMKKIKAMKELEAKHGSEIPLAASMFAVYDNEVTYLFSGAYDELKNAMKANTEAVKKGQSNSDKLIETTKEFFPN